MGEEGTKEEPGIKAGMKNGYRAAGGHKTGTGRRGSFAKGKKTGLGGAWPCPWYPLLSCPLSPMSGWSSYLRMVLLALKPLLTSCWPPIHHLEAFSSAMRGESYGGHHHEMERPEETRMLVGLWLQE